MDTLNSLSDRQQALLRHLLHSQQGLTLDELAQWLNISRNAVIQHVSLLERERFVTTQLRPSTGGRPSKAYFLTDGGKALFPKQYALMSKMILKSLSDSVPAAELEALLKSIGQNLALGFQSEVQASEDKWEAVRLIMEQLGYETQKASDDALKKNEIIAKNCVFHEVAVENSIVCTLDRALMSSLLGEEVEQIECMVKGGNRCHFCSSKA